MGKLKSIKSKMLWARVFKLAFYGIGFPLLLWFLREEKLALAGGYVMGGAADLIVYFGLAAWAVVIVAQLIALIFRSKKARQIFVTAVTLVVVLGSLVFCDLYVNKKIDDMIAEKKPVATYEEQVVKFHTYAKQLEAPLQNFLDVYNIEMSGQLKGREKNTDGSKVTYDKDQDAWFSDNGLYADGYVFGYKAAAKVISTYYDSRAAYLEDHPKADIEKDLEAALAELESNPSSEWSAYKNTAEYRAAYDPETGTAVKYYVTPERLDEILGVLGSIAAANPQVQSLLNALPALLGFIPNVPEGLAETIKDNLNGSLNLEKLMEIVGGFTDAIDEDMIWGLLAQYSFYQSPTTKPAFMFLEDENLKNYAWAKYEGITHGGKVGSILLPTYTVNNEGTEDEEVVVSKVGCITLDASGSDAMSEEDLLDLFDSYDLALEYQPQLYPLIAVRNTLVLYGALCVLGVAVSYFFARIEQKQLDRLSKAAREGGLQ